MFRLHKTKTIRTLHDVQNLTFSSLRTFKGKNQIGTPYLKEYDFGSFWSNFQNVQVPDTKSVQHAYIAVFRC